MRQLIQICVIFLALTLFGIALQAYSQGDVEQSNGDTKTAEQSREKQTNEEQSTVEKTDEEPNPLESQVNNQGEKIGNLESRLNVLEIPQDNLLQTIVLIFGVLTILAFAVFIFLGMRMNKQHLNRLDARDQSWQNRFNESQQQLNGRLQPIIKQGIDLTRKLEEIESNRSGISQKQEQFLSTLAELESRIDDIELNILSVEPDPETDSIIDYQSQVALIVQEAQDRMDDLADAYRNGEPIDLDEIENPSPSQKAILLLNSLARDLHQWKTELEQSGQTDSNLIDTLTYRETDIRDKLNEIRGDRTPTPKQLQEPTDVSTDTELDDFQNQCNVDIGRFEGILSGYEQGREVDLAACDEFILQFIKDRLFNGVARFVPFDKLPEQLDRFLQFVGYEVVPIEIGKTAADTRVHEIQGSRQTGVEPGTIAEVVLPGLRWINDEEIVQKPVVIRGE